MKVLIKAEGHIQVDEVYELETFDEYTIKLHTHEDLLDIIVHLPEGSELTSEAVAEQMYEDGFLDLRKFPTELVNSEDDDDGSWD